MLERGKLDESLALPDGGKLAFERIYPLDADYDVAADVPAELAQSKRYRDHGDFTHRRARGARCAPTSASACLDIVVHSLANGPEVKKPLLETSRKRLPRRRRRERVLVSSRWCSASAR